MHVSRLGAVIAMTVALGSTALPVHGEEATDLGRETLSPGDGWASTNGGTTGGSSATDENVHHVSSWAELREALGGPGNDSRYNDTPKIVYVHGHINANEGADSQLLTCDDYADPEYDFEAYLEEYDPEGDWGPNDPEGELEEARERSHDIQAAQVRQYIGGNTTLVGVGDDAQIEGGSLVVRNADNVIVRNLEISDAYDCFPGWDPNDSGGNWNSEFDNLWVAESENVWVDHVSLNDGDNPPGSLPTYFGQKYEVHDGLLDVTNNADLVTISWSRFTDHDKLMLIGNSNGRTTDRGELRVTMHHNLFENTGQRTPRVRFGQVHVYNNLYRETDEGGYYQYNWGVGVESEIYAENNYFELAPEIGVEDIIYEWGGTMLEEHGTYVNGVTARHRVDVVEAYNEAHPDAQIDDEVSWDPAEEYDAEVNGTPSVPARVSGGAGSGVIG